MKDGRTAAVIRQGLRGRDQMKPMKDTAFTLDGRKTAPGYGEGILLVSMTQRQGLPFSLQVNEDGVESLRGAVDQVKWKDLEFVLQMVRDAICRAGLTPSELMVIEALIVQSSAGWDPVMELYLQDGGSVKVDLQQIKIVVEAVMLGVMQGDLSVVEDAISSELPPIEKELIESVVAERLIKSGGRRIAQPLDVVVDNQAVVRLEGKFAAKPDRSNFRPVPLELVGRPLGFDVSEEALKFDSDQSGKISINYGKLDVDLVEYARLCKDNRKCIVRVHQTTERRGQEIYAFVAFRSAEG